jgi:hypothetical protein
VADAIWTRCQQGPASPVETFLSTLTTAFLITPLAFCALVALPHLGREALSPGAAGPRLGLAGLVVAVPALARWTIRRLFELWGTRWSYRTRDATRWGSVSTLFGWYGAGEGVCLTGFQPTEAGRTPLTSTDALGAGAWIVAACLSRLRGGATPGRFSSFEALMLAALAGLAARGNATISRARELRWRKDWLRGTLRAAPEDTFTIERSREIEDGGEVERRILSALQEIEDLLASPPRDATEGSYREAAARRPAVRVRLDGDLLAPAFDSAAAALDVPAVGGAPVAVAAAIDDFARRDPERMAYLHGLLAAHRRR